MLHKIGQALSGIMLTVLVIACLLLVAPRIFGIQLFSVLSGSMEPAFQVNDLVYAFPAPYEQIKVGDPITFKLNENTIVTHRVIEKDDAKQSLYTKGDANETADGTPTMYSNVIGVVRFYIPMVGGVLQSISSGSGRIIALTAAAVTILLTMLLTINGQPENEEPEEKRGSARVGQAKRGAALARSKRYPMDVEWGLDDGYEAPVRRRPQPQAVLTLDDEWERIVMQQRAQRGQRAEPSRRYASRYEYMGDHDDWPASAYDRFAGGQRMAYDRPIPRAQYPEERGENRRKKAYPDSAAKGQPYTARPAGSRAKEAVMENGRRKLSLPEKPDKRKRTGKQLKTQLPPAWR